MIYYFKRHGRENPILTKKFYIMTQHQNLTKTVNKSQLGQRLDRTLTKLFLGCSRSQIKTWIINGQVKVNGRITVVPKKKC